MVRPKQKSSRELSRKPQKGSLSEPVHGAEGENQEACDARDSRCAHGAGDAGNAGDGKNLRERVRELENQLTQERLLRKQFLLDADQEVITPIHTIIGMLNLLLETDLTTEQREFTESARFTGTRLIQAATQLLEKLQNALAASSPPIISPALREKSSAVPALPSSGILPSSTPDSSPSSTLEHSGGSGSSVTPVSTNVAPSSPAALAVKDSEGVKKRLHHFSLEISPAGVFAIWRAFLQAVPSYLDQLEKALLAGEGVQVNSLACTLNRACLNLGAEGIVELCRRLENLKIVGREPEAWHLFKEIKKSFERLSALPVPGFRNSSPSKPSGDI